MPRYTDICEVSSAKTSPKEPGHQHSTHLEEIDLISDRRPKDLWTMQLPDMMDISV